MVCLAVEESGGGCKARESVRAELEVRLCQLKPYPNLNPAKLNALA
jgi:hypothetical protein